MGANSLQRAPAHPATAADAPRRVAVVWALLIVNVLQFQDLPTALLPLPQSVFQVVAQASLVLAFALALLLNPQVVVRRNVYLPMLSALALLAMASSLSADSGSDSFARSLRLLLFVATLWLLSRWWDGMRLARIHVYALGAILATVLAGLLISPARALGVADGRLAGIIWPIWPTEVGQFSAVVLGLTILMWLTRILSGRHTMLVVTPTLTLLVMSHTRTAMVAVLIGLTVAVVSLASSSVRARRALLVAVGLAGFIAVALGQPLMDWFSRDQSARELSSLTGRQQFWQVLIAEVRTPGETLFGVGLTDKSFSQAVVMTEESLDGKHSIDSSWLVTYLELGEVGVVIVGTLVVLLLVVAFLPPPSPSRACAIFLIIYCVVASYTETGLSDASPYLLHLAVAASLLVRPAEEQLRETA